MPTNECCVPLCTERGGHRFPSAEKRGKIRKEWIVAIRRADRQTKSGIWEPNHNSVVCGNHFQPSDYFSETSYGCKPQVKRLRPDAVPSLFSWKPNPTEVTPRAKRFQRRVAATTSKDSNTPEICGSSFISHVGAECEVESQAMVIDTSLSGTLPSNTPTTSRDAATLTDSTRAASFSALRFQHDPAGMHHYTGLHNFKKFKLVLNSLGPAAYELHYLYGPVRNDFPVIDQFFLVLVKLRKHYTNFELSRFFDIAEAEVYNIFCSWIRFMSLQWRELNIWGNRDLVRFYAPEGFKRDFPKTRVIIDGTECPIKKPSLPTAQQSTYSTYKNRNTVKVLVGVSPGGMCTYLSPAYGGSTSDRQIVERSTLPKDCNPGDVIMSDKGFDVQDIFAPYSVQINIPTFFRKKNRMTQKTVLRDRKISSKRIHVERFIGLAKSYRILQQPLNGSETLLASDIIFCCFMLCNFRSCIVPTDV